MDGTRQERLSMDSVLVHCPSILGKISWLIVWTPANVSNSRYSSNYTYPVRYEGPSRESIQEMPPVLSRQDAIDLFLESVETARAMARFGIQQSLAGSEKVGEAVKLKLTIDLSHKSIEIMPDEIVDILKRDVERYGCAITACGTRALRRSPSKIHDEDNTDTIFSIASSWPIIKYRTFRTGSPSALH